jgi:hypothetical protein
VLAVSDFWSGRAAYSVLPAEQQALLALAVIGTERETELEGDNEAGWLSKALESSSDFDSCSRVVMEEVRWVELVEETVKVGHGPDFVAE